MIAYSEGKHYIGTNFTPNINSIAKRLSFINRFNGDVGAYSVAQHCCLVAMKLPRKLRLSGLLHDASEAYIGDMVSPLKAYLPEYVKLEEHYHDVIDEFFNVNTRHPLIKEVDGQMMLAEAAHFGKIIPYHTQLKKSFIVQINVWGSTKAHRKFMEIYNNEVQRVGKAAP